MGVAGRGVGDVRKSLPYVALYERLVQTAVCVSDVPSSMQTGRPDLELRQDSNAFQRASRSGTVRMLEVDGRALGRWTTTVMGTGMGLFVSWGRYRGVASKTGPVGSCDAVDSVNDALDCQIRNAARWGGRWRARNEVSDVPLDVDGLQKEGMGLLAACW